MRYFDHYVRRQEFLKSHQHVGLKRADEAEVGMYALDSDATSDTLPDLLRYVSAKIDRSEEFYSASPPTSFQLHCNLLKFTSAVGAPHSANSQVVARLYRARAERKRAVVLLPHWNARRADYRAFGIWLARLGITCLQVSLPYHDERQTLTYGYAREFVSENLGRTILANRQAILDARACLAWLERAGYTELAVLGVSLGSSIAALVASHDRRVRAAALLLMADDFADVVWTGSATEHIRASLERHFYLSDVRKAWALISPNTFTPRLAEKMKELLIISGAKDSVFVPKLTQQYVERIRSAGIRPTWKTFGCGHYTLAMFPYNVLALFLTYSYLRKHLGL